MPHTHVFLTHVCDDFAETCCFWHLTQLSALRALQLLPEPGAAFWRLLPRLRAGGLQRLDTVGSLPGFDEEEPSDEEA